VSQELCSGDSRPDDAIAAGVRLEAIRSLRLGADDALTERERALAGYVRGVVAGTVTAAAYRSLEERFGARGAVDYTTFVARTMMELRLSQALAAAGPAGAGERPGSNGASTADRLRALEDERAILETLFAYAYAMDYGSEDEFLDCWTDDAILEWPGREPFVGRKMIREAFAGSPHAPAVFNKHVALQPRIRLDGNRATVTSYYARLRPHAEGPQVNSFGLYLDSLVRCPDGRWRFQHRRVQRETLSRDALDAT
jgi:hypothetical protein